MNREDFQKKYGPWALVTGASSGIGRQIAMVLASKGLHVVVVARNHLLLEETARLVRAYGVEAHVVVADFEQPNAVDLVISEASRLDVGLLVPAAGFGDSGVFIESELALQSAMVQVNITSVMLLAHHYARHMQTRRRGGIIFIASMLAFHGAPYSANYAAIAIANQNAGF